MPAPEPAATAPAAAAADSATGSTAGDAEAGAEIYATNCATCHGSEGGGDGPLSAALDPRPAAHDDGSYMNGLSDEYLAQVIREGGAAVGKSALMAPWRGMLSDQDIADVIAFIRTLADPPYVPAGE